MTFKSAIGGKVCLVLFLEALLYVSPGYAKGFVLEEITVTARRRAESLQDTPISVSAFTADDLEQQLVSNISQIGAATPNLIFDTSSAISGSKSSASVFIRGIGQTDFLLVNDPGVGIYLDGVYIARSIGSVIDLLDIERVEILRGPQGTLFGRNTIGGAINITSKKPSEEFAGHISVTTGSYERLDANLKVSGRLMDNLFGSVTLARFGQDGHIDRPFLGDTTGEDDGWAGRAVLRWLPTEDVEVNISFDGTHRNENSCCEELLAINPAGLMPGFNNFIATVTGQPPSAFATPALVPTEEFVDNATVHRPSDISIIGAAVDVSWALNDNLTVKSISSYRKLESALGTDGDHSPVNLNSTLDSFDAEQFSQELQLQGNGFDNKLNWIAGLYYFDEDGFNSDVVDFATILISSGGEAENRSLAIFGQASYDIIENASLTLGIRWTRDEKEFKPVNNFVIQNRTLGTPFALAVPSVLNSDFTTLPPTLVPLMAGDILIPPGTVAEQEIKEVTPYVSLSYHWTENIMTYISYSEGFKSGGFVQRIFPDRFTVPAFEPEFVEVIEGGVKMTAFDRRLQLNASVFNTDYSDLQIVVFENGAPLTQNAAGADITGFELEAVALPLSDLKINLGVGYLDAEYTDIDAMVVTEVTIDNALVNSPDWSVNLGLAYTLPLMDWGTLTPRIDWSYRTEVYNDARNTPELRQDAYSLVNISLLFEDNAGKWQAQVYGTNVFDERYQLTGVGAPDFQGFITAAFGRPAEWGLMIKRKF